MTLAERYESHVDRSAGPDACHPWTAALHYGYGEITVGSRTDGTIRRRPATHIGWELAFGPIPDETPCVLHRCDNPPCQNPEHWFLGTRADNKAAKGRHGPRLIGEAHHQARLTESDVRAIRSAYATGAGLRPLGRRFGVTHRTISLIVQGDTWAHVGQT
jgi:hypothetical protein